MAQAMDFKMLWARWHEARKLGGDINPDGNRCALTLGAALKLAFKPRKDKGELSFRDISQPPKGMRGQPFLDKFYVKADQFAKRLEEEWGKPDLQATGPSALAALKGKQGVIFIENAWYAGFPMRRKSVDHVDLWDDDRTAAYDAAHTREILERADSVALWLIHSAR
jgi:hypothetical protein